MDWSAHAQTLRTEVWGRIEAYRRSTGPQAWCVLEDAESATLSPADRPTYLLGSGAQIAQPFVAHALAHWPVRGAVDNLRRGQPCAAVPGAPLAGGDEDFRAAARQEPNLLAVVCAVGGDTTPRFEALAADCGVPVLGLFQAWRRGDVATLRTDSPWCAFADIDRHIAVAEAAESLAPALADGLSRATLWACLLYRLSWSSAVLAAVRQPLADEYFGTALLALSVDEVLVDGGAFDGDTIRRFATATKHAWRHIHAFEPDSQTRASLNRAVAGLPAITVHPTALWHSTTTVHFRAAATPGSAVDETAGTTVNAVALDDLTLSPAPTLIKLDVEGAEASALNGAARLLRHHRPKLAVAAYHQVEDIVHLPTLSRQLNPGYRIWLRHHGPTIYDTVLYAA